jgi:hypothetical protein
VGIMPGGGTQRLTRLVGYAPIPGRHYLGAPGRSHPSGRSSTSATTDASLTNWSSAAGFASPHRQIGPVTASPSRRRRSKGLRFGQSADQAGRATSAGARGDGRVVGGGVVSPRSAIAGAGEVRPSQNTAGATVDRRVHGSFVSAMWPNCAGISPWSWAESPRSTSPTSDPGSPRAAWMNGLTVKAPNYCRPSDAAEARLPFASQSPSPR